MIIKPQRGIDEMNNELASELFVKVVSCLNENAIHYWLDFGTLLGVIRDGDFIKSDFDIDIGVRAHIGEGAEKFRELAKLGLYFALDYFEGGGRKFLRKANIIVNEHSNGFAKLEIVPCYKIDDFYYKLTQQKDDKIFGAALPAKFLDRYYTVKFKGIYANVPDQPEELLKYYYGDWETPRNDISSTYKKPFEELDINKLIEQNK